MPVLTDLFVGSCALYVDGYNVGWTRGGIRMRLNRSLWGRPSLSGLGIEEIVKQSEDYYVSTLLVETSMTNLRRAWGINEDAVLGTLNFGGSLTVPTHTLRFTAGDGFFDAYFYKAVAVDFGEIIFSHKQDAVIPVTFRLLLDTTKAVGAQLGYIYRPLSYSDLVCRIDIPKIKTYTIYLRVRTLRETTRSLVSRVTVYYTPSLSNLVSRLVVRQFTERNLVSQVNVYYTPATSSVISRVIVRGQSTLSLVSRVINLNKSSVSLISRILIFKVAAENFIAKVLILKKNTSSLISRTTVSVQSSKNLVARVTALKKSSKNLVCRMTKTS